VLTVQLNLIGDMLFNRQQFSQIIFLKNRSQVEIQCTEQYLENIKSVNMQIGCKLIQIYTNKKVIFLHF